MKVMMLDSNEIVDLDSIEAVRRIDARVAVEAPVQYIGSIPIATEILRDAGALHLADPAPESAMLDRSRQPAVKPRPQPRPAPPREKRRKRS